MATQATEKLIDALAQLVEAYTELREKLEDEYQSEDDDDDDDEDGEGSEEVEAAIVTELRGALESVMDSEDVAAEDLATLLSTMSDALEEIDPDVFESGEEESEEDEDLYEGEDVDEDEEIDYEDDEEFDYDEDEDEEDEDDEEEFEDEEDE